MSTQSLESQTPEDEGELCVNCGERGEDRRTLWMACFYAMEELAVPFGHQVLFHADPATLTPASPPTTLPGRLGLSPINIFPGTVTCSGELTPKKIYTLRVCKDCRSGWMQMIEHWHASFSRVRERAEARQQTTEE